MDEQSPDQTIVIGGGGVGGGGGGGEPVRSRWTPKPEQIVILESIFNSGMVNPPKDETVRIRKLLEKFGSVGDANVFYWFQNRRSRSRRRQRQIQAAIAAASSDSGTHPGGGGGCASATPSLVITSPSSSASTSSPVGFPENQGSDDLFSISRQLGFSDHPPAAAPPYQSGMMTVLINGVPLEVPRGPFDMRAMFGCDSVLFHSSGGALPVDEHGVLSQSLQMGESYYLFTRPNK